jgi:peptidoglycan/xylan/chitin deacetylase (PgdA/CDA1 family)
MMAYILVVSGIFLLILICLVLEYSIFIPAGKGLPVLMYHKVTETTNDGLSVSVAKLRQQFEFIRRKGYQTLSFEELTDAVKTGKPLPKKPLILTFDDAYRDFAENAIPLLSSFNFKATVFIPVGFLGKTNSWDNGSDPILSAGELRELVNRGGIEFGLHSYLHRSYTELDPTGMENDLELCMQTLGSLGIPFVRVLAYPYGAYPKKDPWLREQMKEVFRIKRLQFALRIGNRINRWPLKDFYELKRIDIKGTDSFFTFKTKITKGRRKVFS